MVHRDREYLIRSAWIQTLGLGAKVLSPVLVIALARFFPQEMYGSYISWQLMVFTLSRVTSFGMDRSIVALVAENEEANCQESIARASWMAFALSWIPGLFWWGRGGDLAVALILFGLVPWTLLLVWTGALEGARRPEYRIFLVHVMAFLIAPALGVLAWIYGLGRFSLAVGFLAGNWITAILALVVLHRHFSGIAWWPPAMPRRSFLLYSFPVALSDLVAPLIQRIDLWIIMAVLGPAQAAVYAVMTTLVNGLRTVRQGYDNVVLNLAASARGKGDLVELEGSYASVVRIVSLMQSAVAFVVLLFPDKLLGLAGKNYVVDPRALGIMIVGHLIFGFFGLSGQVLMGMGESRWQFYQSLLALALSAVLNIWWIPLYGLRGAAFASALVLSAQGLGQWLIARRRLGLQLLNRSLIPAGILIVLLTITALGLAFWMG